MSETAASARSRRRQPGDLTPRQREVLDLLAKRHTNGEIAERLGISLSAAKWHVSEIIGELGVDTREEAADWWRRQNGLQARLWRGISAAFAAATARPMAIGAAVVALMVVALVAVLLWQGGDDGTVPATSDETPTVTSTPTSRPATPTASPTPDPFLAYTTFPVPGRDELFVYTVFVEEERVADGVRPVRAVLVQDLATGTLVGHWKFSGKDIGSPQSVVLAGDYVVAATHQQVTRYELDGSNAFVLYQHAGDGVVTDVAASPDGDVVAVSMECYPCYDGGRLIFIDIDNGNESAVIPNGDLQAAGFLGYPWQMSYLPDGSGVVIGGGTGSERPGGRATVYEDGTFTVDLGSPEGYAAISPDGTLLAEPYDHDITGACMHMAADALRIHDLATGETHFDYSAGDAAIAPWEWSPDGTHLLYETLAIVSDEECSWMESPLEFHLLEVSTGSITAVPDINALQRQWYGEDLMEVGCEDWWSGEPVRTRYGKLNAVCVPAGGSVRPGDVFVGATKVASWPLIPSPSGTSGGIELVGFVD